MSAKTSPSSTSRDANVGSSSAIPVQIKKELPSDEIKEFAHNTMNELLGWYGFEGVDVDRLDLTAKTSRLLQSAAAAAVASQQQQHHQSHQNHQHHHQMEQHPSLERKRGSLLRSSRSSLAAAYHNNNNNASSNKNNGGVGGGGAGGGSGRKGGLLNCSSTTTTPSDHDTRSSREEDSKSPHSIGKPAGVPQTEEKIDFSNCCWCHRPIAENAPDYLTSCDGPRYCSESCFAQSRRASFKKAKTCDWCKHVRHAVSYVDFQDGASQLQFCSEKCLNQYKMQIFCHETQAHLDMHPHLRDQALDAGSEAGLITPDLWLRNCRSRSASPASTLSVSPGPPAIPAAPSRCQDSPPSHHPSKPLISVAPVSKLLAQKSPGPAGVPPPPPPPVQRHLGAKMGRRKRRGLSSSSGSETVASLLQKQQQHQQQQHQQQHQQHQATPTLTADFAGSSVPLPPLSPMPSVQESPPQQQAPPQVPPPQALPRGPTAIPASYFATPSNGVPMGHPFVGRPPPPPHHFMHPPPHGMMPRGFGPPFGPPLPPQMPELGALLGAVPPVTVMVPYPIIIPLPIPIPVPLPVMDFYKAHLTPEQRKRFDEERAAPSRQETQGEQEQPLEPLDCSKTRSELEEEKPEVEKPKEPREELDNDQEEDDKESIPKTNPDRDTTPASPSISQESSSSPQETHCIVRDSAQSEPEADSQKLPKLKITRLQTKRTLIQTKEAAAECSRPLRKRKRIIDCDFQKMTVKEPEVATDGSQSNGSSVKEADPDVECNTNSNHSSSGHAKAKK
ncbi:sine oculis-binding protein homolog isoform X2 [Drosophila subpulchrella]|nr:sine oculis-binding protein homolog isoform X2 [Drosophila subpulchrella]